MPNASVTVTNTATNVARSTVTNTSGVYSLPGLVPGTSSAIGRSSAGSSCASEFFLQLAPRAPDGIHLDHAGACVERSLLVRALLTDGLLRR